MAFQKPSIRHVIKERKIYCRFVRKKISFVFFSFFQSVFFPGVSLSCSPRNFYIQFFSSVWLSVSDRKKTLLFSNCARKQRNEEHHRQIWVFLIYLKISVFIVFWSYPKTFLILFAKLNVTTWELKHFPDNN